MSVDEVVAHCLAKLGAAEGYPFGEQTLAAKVGGKCFAYVQLATGGVVVKCGDDADEAAVLRERFPDSVTVADYLRRFGWDRVSVGGSVPGDELRELLDSSYDTIVAKLPKSRRP